MPTEFNIDFEAILRTFKTETEERITDMEQAAMALESDPENEEHLDAIFRGAHTLKGNAGTMGFGPMADFTHALEDLLQRCRAGSWGNAPATLLLQAIDALRDLVADVIGGAETLRPVHAVLMQQLLGWAPHDFNLPSPRVDRAQGEGRRIEEAPALERSDTIRVDIGKLDRLLNLAGEIAIAQGRLREALGNQTGVSRAATVESSEAYEQLERLSQGLQEEIMKVRMVPLGPVFQQLYRVLRDATSATAKEARLVVEGGASEIDLSLIEHLKDPLAHMIRNAVDHGIESPGLRRESGKDPCGLLLLKAFHEGGSIVIHLSDDGAGLDREQILRRGRQQGLIAEGERLSDHDLDQLIFHPGFSTAAAVSDISGRGVGMDVVRRNIEAVRGSVGVSSVRGRGTTVTIRLPLTLAIIDGFSFGVNADTYILPLQCVRECLTLPLEAQGDGPCGVINLRGVPLPFLRLRRRFGLSGGAPAREKVVVVKAGGVQAGLVVDELHGPRQTVIKPLGNNLSCSPGIAGAAILGNGRVALILDAAALLRGAIQDFGKPGDGRDAPEIIQAAG